MAESQFMEGLILSYSNENVHRRVGEVIRCHSTNPEDIRDVVKRSVGWSGIRTVLDLGCGYGWMETSFDTGFEMIFGIDAFEENAPAFLSVAKAKADKAGFEQIRLPAPIPFETETFDLIIAVYSLYFFPGILLEVKRLLKPDGVFLSITHSEGMLEEGEKFFHFKNLRGLIECFSAENGESKLKQYFGRVTCIDYVNSLVFDRDAGDDLALYIAFKGEFILKDADPAVVTERLLKELEKRGTLSFNKNDRIFLAEK